MNVMTASGGWCDGLALQRRPDTDEQRFLSAVQHMAAVLRACGWGEDVLLALGELLELASIRQTDGDAEETERPLLAGNGTP
jgi:hypothetical protein